mmetsp:Transcript_72503/g.219495  ORF Transcript_72503/g.219495 Transcript_72503/m.219495 type:complete len:233 (-) Transcript_72503:171-869(-)
MAVPPATRAAARGRRGGRLAAGGLLAAAGLLLGSFLVPQGDDAFTAAASTRSLRGRVMVRAEEAAAAPAPSPSVALVKVTEESKMTTAGVIGGVAGLLLGGFWVGGALFTAASYLARKEDDDVAKALKGLAAGSLEVLNFGAYVNEKYEVTGKVGSAVTNALGSDNMATVDSVLDSVKAADKDIGFKDTIGTLATSASELACQAVDKAVELNKEYKITDQISEKIEEVTKSK